MLRNQLESPITRSLSLTLCAALPLYAVSAATGCLAGTGPDDQESSLEESGADPTSAPDVAARWVTPEGEQVALALWRADDRTAAGEMTVTHRDGSVEMQQLDLPLVIGEGSSQWFEVDEDGQTYLDVEGMRIQVRDLRTDATGTHGVLVHSDGRELEFDLATHSQTWGTVALVALIAALGAALIAFVCGALVLASMAACIGVHGENACWSWTFGSGFGGDGSGGGLCSGKCEPCVEDNGGGGTGGGGNDEPIIVTP